MKKIMVIGKIGCGKTSLCQKIFNENLNYKKTQTIEILGGTAIDTPGEYLEHRAFYKALIVTSIEADAIVFLHSATDDQFVFSPRMTSMFNKPAIGVITKIDLCDNKNHIENVKNALNYAGINEIFEVSNKTGEGIENILSYINA